MLDFILKNGIYVLPAFLVALAVVLVPYISRTAEWITTLVHEVGHGVLSIPSGGRIGGIRIHSDGSGESDMSYTGGIFFLPIRIFSLLIGYAFPLYVGVVLLFASSKDNIVLGGWVLGIIGIIVLFTIRNLFGLLIVFVYEALFVSFFFLHLNLDPILLFVFMGTLLIFRGLVDIVTVAPLVFRSQDADDDDSDFHLLAMDALLPAPFWYIFFIIFHIVIFFILISILFTL